MIPLYGKSLKKMVDPTYLAFFRALAYDRTLSYGARLLGLVCLDHPEEGKLKLTVVARRMHSSPHQVGEWKKQLERRMYKFAKPIQAQT